MTNSRNVTLFNGVTAGLGLCALLYGVKWLKSACLYANDANTRERILKDFVTSLPSDLQRDESLMSELKEVSEAAARSVGVIGLGYAAGSALFFYSAFGAEHSLKKSQSMGTAATVIGASAAAFAVDDVVNAAHAIYKKHNSK